MSLKTRFVLLSVTLFLTATAGVFAQSPQHPHPAPLPTTRPSPLPTVPVPSVDPNEDYCDRRIFWISLNEEDRSSKEDVLRVFRLIATTAFATVYDVHESYTQMGQPTAALSMIVYYKPGVIPRGPQFDAMKAKLEEIRGVSVRCMNQIPPPPPGGISGSN